jgi:hypothetical protein
MKTSTFLLAMICGLLLGAIPGRALAQDNGGGGGGASPGQVREEVRSLISDLNDPNYDYSKVPDRMREVFQDFRTATQDMDPGQAQQFRQDLFQQLMPTLQANQAKIQAAIQLAFLKSLQTPMGCTDDEFAAIRPYLEKVVQAYMASQVMRFGGPRGPAANTPQPNQQTSDVQKAVDELRTALDDTNSSSDLIKNKLDVLRQAKDKANQDLKVARTELQALLTERQEAVLVEYGLLE